MKYNLLYLFAALMVLTSCGDFFEESSQDEIRPTTIEDLASVLYAEAYPKGNLGDSYLFLLTDEVQSNGLKNESYTSAFNAGQFVYCFDPEMFDGVKTFYDADQNSWKNYYNQIMGCNVILDYAYEMRGDDTERNNIIGQARLLRAYYYLKLACIYCQPWQNGSPDQNLGVVLITTSHVNDVQPSRSTLRETYAFIEQELKLAAQELKDFKPTTKYRVTKTAADILLARLYLYQENWGEAINYATTTINEGPKLSDFVLLLSKYRSVYDLDFSTEVIWNYAGQVCKSYYFNNGQYYAGLLPYSGTAEMLAMYDPTNDIRRQSSTYVQISASMGDYYQKKRNNGGYDGEHGLRMAEAFLIRSEAYARTGKTTEALKDLNDFRETRYKAGTYTAVNITNADELLQFIIDERQREFVWEDGFRWMDIKRLGLSVTHTFIDENGGSTVYTLESNSKLYALPIPNDAISKNKNLVQNPR